jgi:hypothetical protein
MYSAVWALPLLLLSLLSIRLDFRQISFSDEQI